MLKSPPAMRSAVAVISLERAGDVAGNEEPGQRRQRQRGECAGNNGEVCLADLGRIFGRPLLQQVLLFGFHFLEDLAKIVHCIFAFIREHDLLGRLEAVGFAQINRFLQFGKFKLKQWREGLGPGHLFGIVVDQLQQGLAVFFRASSAGGVRRQIAFHPCNQKAALARLGILHVRKQQGQFPLHFMRVRLPNQRLPFVGGCCGRTPRRQ